MNRENMIEQLKDKLDTMSKSQLQTLTETINTKPKKKSIVHRVVDAIDGFLDKTSRIYMYILEVIGVAIIVYLLIEFVAGVRLIYKGDIEHGKAVVDAVKVAITSTKEIIIGMFVAVPGAIGVLRSLSKKWGSNGNGSGSPVVQPPTPAVISQSIAVHEDSRPSDFSSTPTDEP